MDDFVVYLLRQYACSQETTGQLWYPRQYLIFTWTNFWYSSLFVIKWLSNSHHLGNFKWQYLWNGSSDQLHVWFQVRVTRDSGSDLAISSSIKSKMVAMTSHDRRYRQEPSDVAFIKLVRPLCLSHLSEVRTSWPSVPVWDKFLFTCLLINVIFYQWVSL